MGNISSKIIYIIGALLCISYVMIPADEGLLGDGVKDAMSVLSGDMASMLTFFVVPVLVFVIAFIMLLIRKTAKLGFAFACIGAVLFLYMDVKFAMNHQAYIGCYINAVGVIIAMAGAAMAAFTGKTEEQKEETAETPTEIKPMFYGEMGQGAAEDSGADTLAMNALADELFAEVKPNETEFEEGIENLFLDDEQELEEIANEIKESAGNTDFTDHGTDHDSNSSDDSFWI